MSAEHPGEVTKLLQAVSAGNQEASEELFRAVYDDFRRLARSYMARENAGHTLQPTALVHEAYVKLVDQTRVDWKDRSHFLAVGATAMRRILVNHAVAKKRDKRGGDAPKVQLDEGLAMSRHRDEDVLAIDEALKDLAKLNERHAKLVELRFFGGLTVEETAEVLGVSPRTIKADWRLCRAWLRQQLEPPGSN